MKRLRLLLLSIAFALTSCDGWPVRPNYYNPSPVAPSRTPAIHTATPVIIAPSTTTVVNPSETPGALTPSVEPPTATLVAVPSDTSTPTTTPGSIEAEVLGCSTSFDLTHGMGEVTDAYVTIRNRTAADAADLCATLNGLDEARPHPDKTKCLPTLQAGYQVTLKLTVDTTFKENTPIQVDVTAGGTLLQRVGSASCPDIGLAVPPPAGLGTPDPMP